MDPDTARRELADIRSWMEEGRRVMVETWRHQVWWGVVSAVALVATWWAVEQEAWGAAWILWPVALTIGWSGSALLGRAGPPRARNQATRAFESLWVGTGVTLTVVGTVGLYGGGLAPTAFPGVVAAVFGAAYFTAARIASLPALRWVALAWWVGAAGLLLWPSDASLLVLAALALLLEAGPGLALSRLPEGRP